METDMDTGSSAAAASLCGRCRGLSRNLDVDLGIVLQVTLRKPSVQRSSRCVLSTAAVSRGFSAAC